MDVVVLGGGVAERLSDVWSAAGELDLPILIHTADPAAFFEPLDGTNERLEELVDHPDWYFGDATRFPRMQTLLDAFEEVVAAHPDVTVIGAHVGCYVEDLAWVDRMLSTYPAASSPPCAVDSRVARGPRLVPWRGTAPATGSGRTRADQETSGGRWTAVPTEWWTGLVHRVGVIP